MKVTCQSCQARYTIADEKVRGKVAKIRCKKCGTTILVDGTDGAGSSAGDAPVSTGSAADSAQLAVDAADAVLAASPEPVPAAKPVAPAPEPVALRRPGRAAGTDLFSGARQEEVIATSAPATPSLPHVADAGAEKLTGARNENSVLFSLSALTGSSNGGPPAPGPEAVPSSRTADLRSLMGPSPSAPSKDNKSKLDDIMNLGGGGLYSPALISPALAPPPLELSVSAQDASTAPKGKGRWLGIAAAVVLIGGGVTAFAMMKGGENTAASTIGSASPSATVAAHALTATGTAEPAPTASANAAPTESATASAAVAAQPAPEPTPAAIAPGQAPPPKPEPERERKPTTVAAAAPKLEKPAPVEKPVAAAPTPAPAPAPPAVTQAALTGLASGEFDRAAAGSILSNTATAAQGCKKPDGPTGSGRVAVTFGNNGVATTATIEGPPFAGTAVGGCIAGRFRSSRVPPFAGSPVTVHKSFFIN